uniref:Uncharacterized protein n=1 Tax=Arundo donax TaxID=35708 RepID=A0A0A9F7Y1_ARUDO
MTPDRIPNRLQHDTRPYGPKEGDAAP